MASSVMSRSSDRRHSHLHVHYNLQFPLEDILSVLYPLFAPFYAYDAFIEMIQSVNHTFCVYDQHQARPIACALLNDVGSKGGLYLMLFGVRQNQQSRGTGTFLLSRVIRWARQMGHSFIYLHVHVKNHKAIGLYQKMGFRVHEYLPNYYYPKPKQPPHALRMTLLL